MFRNFQEGLGGKGRSTTSYSRVTPQRLEDEALMFRTYQKNSPQKNEEGVEIIVCCFVFH